MKLKTVVQAIPNWVAVALEASNNIRAKLKACTVLINADEMFINFYPRDTEFVVPTGTRRVGSNVASDAKKGCTVMVSAEMYSSMILSPFIVMTATHNGTLARRFASWRDKGGDASVHFQPPHWMDTPTAKQYIDFLISLFPCQKIGLIWDAASAHTCQEVIDYLELKGVMYEFIPA
ncbi:hypothetical protein AM587_10017365 [Phytophthora nicotianae]|uniref:DDE-1 domain-containing protein n=1 Tax=Phytophthora nicotianae TaxID=4792 RepID=A0A0W8CUM0_PHYNI|nr:hypothetical protein AM587_10017365 [Phytophthora nicotianae]